MLKITIQESDKAIEIKLEGRVAGPWAAELSRAWMETAPQLGQRNLLIDLRNVTYSDAIGKQALQEIYTQTQAKLVTSSPWTQYLAEEIMHSQERRVDEEVVHGKHS
jgi:anti-anti-sigma regulatory factor